MKILIVDDSENFRFLCEQELKDEGYETITADSGARALELFRKDRPGLVILDIKMPEMDGLDILERMKDIDGDVPVIMHTSFDHMYDLACEASDGYIVKSSDFTQLKKAVARIIERRKQEDAAREEEAFSPIVVEIRRESLDKLRALGAEDDASLRKMINEAISDYLKNKC